MTFRDRDAHPDELISASLTGDLDPAEQALLTEHLAGCASCRETLEAFREQRRMVHAMRQATPPRDLAARVQAGIEAGRFARGAWWRRPRLLTGIAASLGTVAAGILVVVVLANLRPTEVAVSSPSPATASPASVAPSPSPVASQTAVPTAVPIIVLGRGDVGIFVASGGTPTQPTRSLQFIDITNERALSVESGSGVPISAALSPTGEWLAYITNIGESGAQEVVAIRLADGETVHLGCSVTWNFTDRLTWSPDGRFLAYSLSGTELGSSQPRCAASKQPVGMVDAWIFNARTEHASRLTVTGDAYAADFVPDPGPDAAPTLLVSHAAVEPWSEEKVVVGVLSAETAPIPGVFMPRLSPDGHRAMFWNGMMDIDVAGQWLFVRGGLPYVSPASEAAWDPSSGADPLFRDLTPVSGEAFTSGNLAWSADSRYVAFWNGAWTGTPQNAAGDYPSQADAYVGRADVGLGESSRVLSLATDQYVEDVRFDADGRLVLVMVASASAGIGDAPTAVIYQVTLDGSRDPTPLDGAALDPATWFGPPVVGQDAPSPAP
jgi:hypothetical protein